MRLNLQLSEQLSLYEKIVSTPKPVATPSTAIKLPRHWPKEIVAGGDILWKPVDKAAAMLLAKSPWWAHAPHVSSPPSIPEPKPKKRKRKMERQYNTEPVMPLSDYVSDAGIKVKVVNGEPMFSLEDVDRVLAERVAKLPAETRPNVLAAQDARKIIRELLDGIGGEMEKFNVNSSKYLQDIRQTRFAVVSETASMTKELKDVRQFFLGNDYQEQIVRLREFVDLCERLQKLKQSGFLDSIADTMLRLAVNQ